MANAKEEGWESRSSTDGRASRKSGHHRWSQRVVLPPLLGDKRLDKVDMSQVPVKYSASVTRQAHASCIKQECSQLIGIVKFR